MKPHGNSLDNPNLHNLYDIFRIANGNTYKFGISDDPIEEDGLSERIRKQVIEMNRAAEFDKYAGQILIKNIEGRLEATRIERHHIDAYYDKHSCNPVGNIIPKRKN